MNRFTLPKYPYPPRFPGFPDPIWIRHREIIGRFIKEHRLESIPAEYLGADIKPADPEPKVEWPRRPWPIPFPGGLRIPHLHFRGEIFELEPEQWREFSRPVLNELRAKLEAAETVDFGTMVELSDAIDGIH